MDNRGEERRNRFSPRPAGRSDNRRDNAPRPGRPARDRDGKPGFDRGEGRPPRPDRPDHANRPYGGPRNRELAAVQETDEELLRLIMRRARLLGKLRTGGGRLDADVEKALRTAWEEKAARLTRDSRLARDLFQLLQAVEPLSRVEEEQAFFNLAPALKPVDVRLPAPADSRAARCWMALAAASGHITSLEGVPLTDGVVEAVKAFNQLGGQLWWEEDGTILSRGGKGLQRGLDKVVHVGDDALNLWLVLAFGLGMPARLKITGGSPLRFLDLAPLRHFLPDLGARLTNVVPGQDGLPVRLECSGMLPAEISLPGDLPPDFAAALLLAAPFWERSCRFALPECSPLAETALAVLAEAGANVSRGERTVTVTPGPLRLPERPALPMDPVLTSALLALPALAGGSVRLEGRQGAGRAAELARALLDGAGLKLEFSAREACSAKDENAEPKAPAPDLVGAAARDCPDLLPLAVLLAAVAARHGASAALPEELPEAEVADGFLERLGLNRDGDGVLRVADDATAPPAWIAPSAPWAVALALGAFLRPNTRLANPGVLTGLFPAFWTLYNTLPTPDISRKKTETVDAKPARRRIIAQGVYGELPPDPPAGDDDWH